VSLVPKADRMFGISRLMEQCPEIKPFIYGFIALMIIIWAEIYISGAVTVSDLEGDLETVVGIEYYSFDEIMVLVGPAWGYNVSRDGIVTLNDGEFDLSLFRGDKSGIR